MVIFHSYVNVYQAGYVALIGFSGLYLSIRQKCRWSFRETTNHQVCIFPDIVHRVHFMMRPDLSGVSYAAFCLRIAMQWSINALALTGAIRAFVLLSGLLIPRMYQRSRFGLALTMAGGCIMMVNVRLRFAVDVFCVSLLWIHRSGNL